MEKECFNCKKIVLCTCQKCRIALENQYEEYKEVITNKPNTNKYFYSYPVCTYQPKNKYKFETCVVGTDRSVDMDLFEIPVWITVCSDKCAGLLIN